MRLLAPGRGVAYLSLLRIVWPLVALRKNWGGEMPGLFIILLTNLEARGRKLLSRRGLISVSHLLLIVLFVIFCRLKIDIMGIL